MAKLMLVDQGGVFFIQIVEESGAVLGKASMGRRGLELAARRFRQAAHSLQAREPRPEGQEDGSTWLPPLGHIKA